ncbi:MAG: exodeoxyribonuclease VII small subunit [Clostridia bacterium]
MIYENNIKELEKILKQLEEEKLSLEDSLKLYAIGVELAKDSLEELNTFKGKMEILDKQLKELEIPNDDD